MGVGGQRHAPAVLPLGKTRYPLYRRLGRHQGRSGSGAKNFAPTGIRSPDCPARSGISRTNVHAAGTDFGRPKGHNYGFILLRQRCPSELFAYCHGYTCINPTYNATELLNQCQSGEKMRQFVRGILFKNNYTSVG
jgi:hypothetical protein